jgi:hypothetical protein
MKMISVDGMLYDCSEDLQRKGYSIRVDLEVDDDEKITSYTLISGPRGWPPTGDYKLTYSYGSQRHEAHGRIEHQTWQQANFGGV